ncbi:MAG: ABC transporter permease, partial [Parasporobacterium sp.]|nr:ABC transporter permease [Parasporobacterium sp.]
MDQIQKDLLATVADIHEVPEGAYNIRANGQLGGRNTTANIDIVTKEDKPGIDIIIKPGTKNESVHIPVIISESGLKDLVYNDFFIGDDADVTIVAGCGIHNCGD